MILGGINYGSLLSASNHIGINPHELQNMLLEASVTNKDITELLCKRFNVPYRKETTFVARRIFERKQNLADFLGISLQGLTIGLNKGRTIDDIISIRNRDVANGSVNLRQVGLDYISEENKSRLQGDQIHSGVGYISEEDRIGLRANRISLSDAQVIKRIFQFDSFSETRDFILKHRRSM